MDHAKGCSSQAEAFEVHGAKNVKKDDGRVVVVPPQLTTPDLVEASTGVDQPIPLAKGMKYRLEEEEEDGDKNDGKMNHRHMVVEAATETPVHPLACAGKYGLLA